MPTTPQDRKPKAAKVFTFKVGTKTHTLPLASKGKNALSGRDLRDASIGGDAGQLAYLFKVLEAAKPAQTALDALYDLPQDKTVEVLADWADFGDGDGASLGESKA